MNAFTVAKKLEKDASDLYSNLARQTGASGLRALITDLATDHQTRYHTLNALTGSSACPTDTSQNLRGLAETLLSRLLAMQCAPPGKMSQALSAPLWSLNQPPPISMSNFRTLPPGVPCGDFFNN